MKEARRRIYERRALRLILQKIRLLRSDACAIGNEAANYCRMDLIGLAENGGSRFLYEAMAFGEKYAPANDAEDDNRPSQYVRSIWQTGWFLYHCAKRRTDESYVWQCQIDPETPFPAIAGYSGKVTAELSDFGLSEIESRIASNARLILISAVERDLVRPNKAEWFARKTRIGQIERRPPVDRFSSEDEPRWTLPMAIMWIATRDTRHVMTQSPDYNEDCLRWFRRGKRWSLEQPDTPSVSKLLFGIYAVGFDGELMDHDRLKAAKKELWSKLIAGDVVASGLDRGEVRDIPSAEWSYLEERERSRQLAAPGRLVATYDDVTLPQSELRKQWKQSAPLSDAGVTRDQAVRRVRAEFMKWLTALKAQWDANELVTFPTLTEDRKRFAQWGGRVLSEQDCQDIRKLARDAPFNFNEENYFQQGPRKPLKKHSF